MASASRLSRGHQFVPLALLLALVLCAQPSQGQPYHDAKSVLDTVLATTNYNPDLRPLRDQSDTLHIYVSFNLVSLVAVDDVSQSFECNGFFSIYWFDQILRWNQSEFGGQTSITPKVGQVFSPTIILMNTLGNRVMFSDDKANLNVNASGFVEWNTGSIIRASCQLDMTKYPFDVQTCGFQMAAMNFGFDELRFHTFSDEVSFLFFYPNGQWDIIDTKVHAPVIQLGEDFTLGALEVSFTMRRKPQFLIISIILPTVFLSLLNLMVFVIPEESGEKISYGITVLLALAVFMSIMSAMLPRSSDSMPLVITYIFILMTISVLTVAVSIVIVKLHHMEEKEEKSLKSELNTKSRPMALSLRQVAPLDSLLRMSEEYPRDRSRNGRNSADTSNKTQLSAQTMKTALGSSDLFWSREEPKVKVNKFKVIGENIDMVSLVVFGVAWAGVTIGFMVAIAT